MANTSSVSIVTSEEPRSEGPGNPRKSLVARSFAKRMRSPDDIENGRDALANPTANTLKDQPPEVLEHYYAQTASDFFGIIDDYLVQANMAATNYKAASRSYARWRFWTIIATGGLAAINVCAALDILRVPIGGTTLPIVLNAVAALYAGCLTVAGNIENFFNKGEQAAGFRESRDLLLSRYREYSAKWLCCVEAYGRTPTAYLNAGRLYRQLVDTDQVVRQKLKQLNEVRGKDRSKASAKGQS